MTSTGPASRSPRISAHLAGSAARPGDAETGVPALSRLHLEARDPRCSDHPPPTASPAGPADGAGLRPQAPPCLSRLPNGPPPPDYKGQECNGKASNTAAK